LNVSQGRGSDADWVIMIADCQLAIADFRSRRQLLQIGNRQLEIGNDWWKS
jgi:hypothetical protein